MGTDTENLSRGLAKWEVVDKLSDIALRHCEGCLVEIGIGFSTYVLAQRARKAERTLYSCDLPGKRTKKLFDDHVINLQGSAHFIKEFKPQPIAIVFLDGCHDYDVVGAEVDFFLPFLSPGGLMFIHDTLPPNERYLPSHKCSDSYKVRRELEQNPRVNCFTWPYTAGGVGLTMVMSKPKEMIGL